MASSDYDTYGTLHAKNVKIDQSGIIFVDPNDDSKTCTLKVSGLGAGNVVINLPSTAGSLSYSTSLSPGDIDNSNLFASGVVDSAAIADGTIVNADISGSANLAYSKLDLNNSVTNADLAGSIAYSKLTLTNSVVNGDLAGSIADAKLASGPTTAGTAEASKYVKLDASKDIAGLNDVSMANANVDQGSGAYYIGDASTDGSWEVKISAGDLVFSKREAGTFNLKHTIAA